ncbi:winged helix-turn-helix domain-containing protein [Oerskovia sp. M15]
MTVDGSVQRLTYKEFELLSHLSRSAHRVVTRDELLSTVWERTPCGTGAGPSTSTCAGCAKLGLQHVITTVRGLGYRFDPQTHVVLSGPGTPPEGWCCRVGRSWSRGDQCGPAAHPRADAGSRLTSGEACACARGQQCSRRRRGRFGHVAEARLDGPVHPLRPRGPPAVPALPCVTRPVAGLLVAVGALTLLTGCIGTGADAAPVDARDPVITRSAAAHSSPSSPTPGTPRTPRGTPPPSNPS